jgi:hypothetical protein
MFALLALSTPAHAAGWYNEGYSDQAPRPSCGGPDGCAKYRIDAPTANSRFHIEPRQNFAHRPGDFGAVIVSPPAWLHPNADQLMLRVHFDGSYFGATGKDWRAQVCVPTCGYHIWRGGNPQVDIPIGRAEANVKIELERTGTGTLTGTTVKDILLLARTEWFAYDSTPPNYDITVNGAPNKGNYGPEGASVSIENVTDNTEIKDGTIKINDQPAGSLDSDVAVGDGQNVKVSAHVCDKVDNCTDKDIYVTVDTTPPVIQGVNPVITLNTPGAGIPVTVIDPPTGGYASQPASVTMKYGDQSFGGVVSPTGGGTYMLYPNLPEGVYDGVTLKAKDNFGNESVDLPPFKLYVDYSPPTVSVTSPIPGGKYPGGQAPSTVNFTASDNLGVTFVGLKFDGADIPLHDVTIDGSDLQTAVPVAAEIDGAQCTGSHSIQVTVTDVGGQTINPSIPWTVGKIKHDRALARHCKKIVCDHAKTVLKQATTNYNTLRGQQRDVQRSYARRNRGPKKNRPTAEQVASMRTQLATLRPQVRAARAAKNTASRAKRKTCR